MFSFVFVSRIVVPGFGDQPILALNAHILMMTSTTFARDTVSVGTL